MLRSFFSLCFVSVLVISLAQNTLERTQCFQSYKKAEDLLERNRYSGARSQYLDYLKCENSDSLVSLDSKFKASYCLLKKGDQTSIPELVSLVELYPTHPFANTAFYEIGNYYYFQKDYENTVRFLSQVDFAPLDEDQQLSGRFRLAYSYFLTKNIGEAEKLFDRVKLKDGKYKAASNYYSANIKLKNKKYDKALKDFEIAGQSPAYESVVPYLITNIYYQQSKYDSLISYGQRVLDSHKNVSNKKEIFLLLGEAYFYVPDYLKCSESLKKYVGENKSTASREVVYKLAFSLYKLDDKNEAITYFKEIAAIEDSLGQFSSYYLGQSYLAMSNKPMAIQALQFSEKLDFNKKIKEYSAFDLGKLYYEEGAFEKTIVHLLDFNKSYPKSAFLDESNEVIGKSYFNTNNYSSSIEYFKKLPKSPKIDSQLQLVLYLKGVELYNASFYEDAGSYFDQSVMYPQNKTTLVAAYFWRAECYSLLRDWNKAVNTYARIFVNSSEQLSPYYLKAHYGIGHAYFNRGEFDKARIKFEIFVSKSDRDDEFYGDAMLRLGDCYLKMKKDSQGGVNYLEKAKNAYLNAIKQDVKNKAYAYLQLGLVYEFEGDVEKSAQNYDKVVNSFSNSPYKITALYEKGRMYQEKGYWNKAVAAFTHFLREDRNHKKAIDVLRRRGNCYDNIENYELAINDYRYIIDNYCSDSLAEIALDELELILVKKIQKPNDYKVLLDQYFLCNKDTSKSGLIRVKLFSLAEELYNIHNNEAAIKQFNEFLIKFPNAPENKKVYYYLADSYYSLPNYNQALNYYKKVLTDGENDDYEKSLYRITQINLSIEDYPEAKAYALILLRKASNLIRHQLALSSLVKSYYETESYDSCKFYCEYIIKGENVLVKSKKMAMLYEAKSNYRLGLSNKAIDQFVSLINISGNSEFGAEANFYLALCLYDKKEYTQSIESLRELAKNFDTYDYWYEKSFILKAQNYIALGEDYHAITVLSSVVENSIIEEIKLDAQKRLKKLEKGQAVAETLDGSLEMVEDDSSTISIDSTQIQKNTIKFDLPKSIISTPDSTDE